MAKITVEKNLLIVSILIISIVSCAVSAGISSWITNSTIQDNSITGQKGDKGDPGERGPAGQPGSTGVAGASGAKGDKGDTGVQDPNKADYDSGWVDISSLTGQSLTLNHNLNTNNTLVQIEGRDAAGNIHQKYLGLDTSTVLGWSRTFGEVSSISGSSMVETSDGAYVITGNARTVLNGELNAFLLKLEAYGEGWFRSFEFGGTSVGTTVIQTTDGGYAVTGRAYSSATEDFVTFLVKTDGEGVLEWNQTYGADYLYGQSVVQTSDGGYVISGETFDVDSFDYNIFLIKTDADGAFVWGNTYGGEGGHTVIQTADGGYAIVGSKMDPATYYDHVYLVKTHSDGTLQWTQTYGTSDEDQYCYSLIGTSDGGYAIAGYTLAAERNSVYLVKVQADGTLDWDQTYDRGTDSYSFSVIQTGDSGYAIAGVIENTDDADVLVIKTQADGTLQWAKTYGQTDNEVGLAIISSSDGGYVVVGYSEPLTAQYDRLYMLWTSSDGTLEWSETFGGKNQDYAYSMTPTSDGGYAVVGYTTSTITYYADVYFIKTSGTGIIEWSKTYDIANEDRAVSVIQTPDGGYAIAGYSENGVFLIKTYANGTIQWSKSYDSANGAEVYAMVQAPDGGYTLVGSINSPTTSSIDVYLIKTDADGNLQWTQTYGTTANEHGISMVRTSDGGYAIAGRVSLWNSSSMTTKVDSYLIKTYANGTLEWSQIYSITDNNSANSLIQTSDGGYALAGQIQSSATYTYDVYLIKTYPNGTLQWSQTYGGTDDDYAYTVIVAGNGGYVLAGATRSLYDISYDGLLIKTFANGTVEWSQTYSGADGDRFMAVVESKDGGYILAGYGRSLTGNSDVYLVKITVTLEFGLARVSSTANTLTLYRGADDADWKYVRVQIWKAD
jgi:hypothetical protein